MSWGLLAAVAAVLALLAWRRVGLLTWVLVLWAALFGVLRWGFVVPIPRSVLAMYLAIGTAALVVYVLSDRGRQESVTRPLVALVVEPRLRLPLAALVLALPAAVAGAIYLRMTAPPTAPSFARTVHPAPPDKITVHDTEYDLITLQNPLRELETSSPEEFQRHLAAGRETYYQNCFYCHGDLMQGDGMFAHALVPIPTNFQDPGTIAMLQESFLFWRIAKGAPGLPMESGPWESAMPAWERFLSEEEIWEVVTFLYDYTGYRPRAREEGEH